LKRESVKTGAVSMGTESPTGVINTRLQRGGLSSRTTVNRVSGFQHPIKTAEAVRGYWTPRPTPLKRGVNESGDQARFAAERLRRTRFNVLTYLTF
jgi:hypothetical protein